MVSDPTELSSRDFFIPQIIPKGEYSVQGYILQSEPKTKAGTEDISKVIAFVKIDFQEEPRQFFKQALKKSEYTED